MTRASSLDDGRSPVLGPSQGSTPETIILSSTKSASPETSNRTEDNDRVALIVIAHPDSARLGNRYIIDVDGDYEVGRSDTATISLPDVRSVSRHHALMRRRLGKAHIEDLGTRNGTFVNDRPIRGQLELHSGDRIQVGSVHLKFLCEFDVEYAYHEHVSRRFSPDVSGESGANLKPPSTDPVPERPGTLGLKVALDDDSRIWIPQLVSSALLLVALDTGNPYEYYTLLRWVCSACFAYLAYKALSRNRPPWAWIFGVLAFLYNPIWPLHLTRQLWTRINVATIALAIASIVALSSTKAR